MDQKTKSLCIDKDFSIIDSLKLMEQLSTKALLVLDGNILLSVLSIGDIQRSIIKNIDLDRKVSNILRLNYNYCSINDSIDEVKAKMLTLKSQFMPLVDEYNKLVDVIHFNDLFEAHNKCSLINKKDIQIVIMAGGRGTRLKPLTNIIPKPLVPYGNKSMIEAIIESFKNNGFKQFVLSANYKHKILKMYLDEINFDGLTLKYIVEHEEMGTIGSLKLMEKTLSDIFIVTNCDVLIKQKYEEVLEYHIKSCYDLTIISAVISNEFPYGVLETNCDGVFIHMNEKPRQTKKVNTGIYVFNRSLIPIIDKYSLKDFDKLLTKLIELKKSIGIFPVSEGSWIDIGQSLSSG